MSQNLEVRVGRIYAESATEDGVRVLVDRLWPRGMTKTHAHLDEWCRQVAPSTALRTWYRHDSARFGEFTRRYLEELTKPEQAEALAHLRELARDHPVTLHTAAKFPTLSEAAVLADLLTSPPPSP